MKTVMTRTVRALQFLLNPHLVLCFGIAWMITNGWAYLGVAAGTLLRCEWLAALSSAYLAFLWFPFTAEKIVTTVIAVSLLKRFFPYDEKTLKVLEDLKGRISKRLVRKTSSEEQDGRSSGREEDP